MTGGIDSGLPRGNNSNYDRLPIFTNQDNSKWQSGSVEKAKQTLQARSWEKTKSKLRPAGEEAQPIRARARSSLIARADSALCERPGLNVSPKNAPKELRVGAHRESRVAFRTLSTTSADINPASTGTTSRSSSLTRNHNFSTDTTQDSGPLASHILPNADSRNASSGHSARSDSVRSTETAETGAIEGETADALTETPTVRTTTTAADEAQAKAARGAIRNNFLYTKGTKLQIDAQGLPQDGGGYKSVTHYLLAVKARQLALDNRNNPRNKERFERAEEVILNAATVQDALEWADLKLGQECNPIPDRTQHKYDRLFEGKIMEDALKLALHCKFIDRKTGEPTQEGKLLLTTGDKAISIQDDSGSTKWQSSYSEHYLDKKGNVIMKNDEPVTNTYEGNNLMGQELEKIRTQMRQTPAGMSRSEYQNLPSPAEMLAMAQQQEAPTPTSHYQSLPIVDEEIKRRHEAGKRAAEQAALQQTPVNATSTRRTNAIPEMLYPVMPVHKHIDLSTGQLKNIYNLNYDKYLRDGLLTPLEEGKEIATSYTKKKVVEFYREKETPATKELGNFHPAPIKFTFHGEEHLFQNAEAAFQAVKVMHMFDNDPNAAVVIGQLKDARRGDEAFAIMQEFNAKLQSDKNLGRLWGTISQQVMYQILMAKFTQNPELREKLLSTGDKPLIENTGGFGKQTDWGVNTSGENAGKGKNQLGRLLEVVRDSLRQ